MSRRRDPAPPKYEIDLHGMTVARATRRLEQELYTLRVRRETPVLVITGRGWGSPSGKAVLGPAIRAWLESPAGAALGVVRCHPVQRGGALVVDLSPPGD